MILILAGRTSIGPFYVNGQTVINVVLGLEKGEKMAHY